MPTRGNIIDATLSPGMATGNPASPKPHATHDSVLLDGLKCVVRARRVVAADIPIERRDDCAINSKNRNADIAREKEHESSRALHLLPTALPRESAISDRRLTQELSDKPGSALTTTSVPVPRVGRAVRHADLSRRRTRFRVTALPTALVMMNPKRTGSPGAVART